MMPIANRALLSVLILAAVIWSPLEVRADQSDRRLDALFAQLQQTRDQGEATELTQQIWRIWQQNEDEKTTALMARGITAMSLRKYEDALAAFDEVVNRAPNFAEGWNKRATVYYLLENYDASVNDVFETLRLEPRHFGAISGLGLNFLELGKDKLALGAFVKALTINPHLPDARAHVRDLKKKLGGQAI